MSILSFKNTKIQTTEEGKLFVCCVQLYVWCTCGVNTSVDHWSSHRKLWSWDITCSLVARDSEIVKLDNYCYRLLIHCVNKRQFLQDCDHHLARQDWFLWIHESGKWRILIVKCQRFYSNELDWTRCDEEVFMTWFCFYLWN